MEYPDAGHSAVSGSVVAERAPDAIDQNEGLTIKARQLEGTERFGHAYHRLLVGADAIALTLSVAVAFAAARLVGADTHAARWFATAMLLLPVWVLFAYQAGLYGQVERRFTFDYVTELSPTLVAVTLWAWVVLVIGTLAAAKGPNVFGPVVVWIVSIPTILILRALARKVARTRDWFTRSVALIGDFSSIETVRQRIDRHPEWGIEVGLCLTRLPNSSWQLGQGREGEDDEVQVLDAIDSSPIFMTRLIKRAGIGRAIIAGGSDELSSRLELAHTMLDRGVAVDFVSGLPETMYGTSITQHLEGVSLMSSRPSYPRPMDRLLKRALDILLSSILLILAAPVLLFVAIWIKLDSRGPVFFRQIRSGLDEQEFELVKLRTMYVGAHQEREALRNATIGEGNDDVLFKLESDPRVTKAGRWLRRTSLDEVPQFWNVLKGDMSMVGPRPLVPEEAEMASGMYVARFKVKPGIAGPWQAEGRSEIPFEDMLKLDYSYVAGWSMVEDLKLLLRTFSAVIVRRGAK